MNNSLSIKKEKWFYLIRLFNTFLHKENISTQQPSLHASAHAFMMGYGFFFTVYEIIALKRQAKAKIKNIEIKR